MGIQIYNSLTKKKEPFVPLRDKIVNMYACGVTVYDACHIGHGRSLYIFDVIRRYLQFRGYDVRFVRNITDVDDKIIKKARDTGRTSQQVADDNIALYHRDLDALGVARADEEPQATENIPEMIRHIGGLIDQGFAYESGGDVYFAVRKFPEYGKLSGQSVEKMREAVRIEAGELKKDPLDFALWKKSKEGEPSWDSPWGRGRPGWHIECSCMSMKHLYTETLDIHAGGRDLIFPHHENEVAQSEALTGKLFAKYWIHHGLLTINGQKMAKSLGNFITIQDAVKKYTREDLKLFYLSSHYASPIDFSEEKLQEAHKALQRLAIFCQEAGASDSAGLPPDAGVEADIARARDAFLAAMDDDFNTPRALGVLFELVNETYRHKEEASYPLRLSRAAGLLQGFGRDLLGLFPDETKSGGVSGEIDALLAERLSSRQNKDFKRADEIRDLLKEKGVVVEDTPQGQRWRKA